MVQNGCGDDLNSGTHPHLLLDQYLTILRDFLCRNVLIVPSYQNIYMSH